MPIKILLIDDDDLIRMTCCNVLKKEGYTVIQAENGKDGVQCFKEKNPDVVITDMLMPDKEGLETISDIRAVDPKSKIIAMSGGGITQNMSFLKLAKKMGADCVLKKPFKPKELISAVQFLTLT